MDHTISGAGFRRRIYHGPLHFLRDLGRVAGVFGTVLALSMKGGISAGFRERLMLVVTAVNRCRHCAWGHQIFARHAGLSQAEIAALLMLDLGNCPADELPGCAMRSTAPNATGSQRPRPAPSSTRLMAPPWRARSTRPAC